MIIGDSVMVAIDWYGSFVKPHARVITPRRGRNELVIVGDVSMVTNDWYGSFCETPCKNQNTQNREE